MAAKKKTTKKPTAEEPAATVDAQDDPWIRLRFDLARQGKRDGAAVLAMLQYVVQFGDVDDLRALRTVASGAFDKIRRRHARSEGLLSKIVDPAERGAVEEALRKEPPRASGKRGRSEENEFWAALVQDVEVAREGASGHLILERTIWGVRSFLGAAGRPPDEGATARLTSLSLADADAFVKAVVKACGGNVHNWGNAAVKKRGRDHKKRLADKKRARGA